MEKINKNLIIGILVIAVLALGIFLFQKNQNGDVAFERNLKCAEFSDKAKQKILELEQSYGGLHYYESLEVFYSPALDTCLSLYRRYNIAKQNPDGSNDIPSTSWRLYDLLADKEVFDSFASINYFEPTPEKVNEAVLAFKGNNRTKVDGLMKNLPLILIDGQTLDEYAKENSGE